MGLMFPRETKSVIECLLFVSKEPLTLKTMSQIMELPEEEIKTLIEELITEYNNEQRGINIQLVANGYQMYTRPEFAPYIEKLYKPQSTYGLSKAALETLAIIAYKQPITRAEIEAIRGVKVDSSLGTLIEKNLVKEVGRKEGPGRPILFGTTPGFLRYFGLKDLSELPDPEEFAYRHGNADRLDFDMENKQREGEQMNFDAIKTIAVVGLSDKPEKASYRVAKYLQECGYRIIPVNPMVDEVLGEKSFPDLNSIPADIEIDVVDIFRRPVDVPPVVEQAVARKGVKVVWMQEGIVHEEAAEVARRAGLEVVMDRCILKEHQKCKLNK